MRFACFLLFTLMVFLPSRSFAKPQPPPEPPTEKELPKPAPVPKPLTDEELLQKAGIKNEGKELLEYLRSRIVTDADPEKVKELVKKLGDDDFKVREEASAALVKYRSLAEPHLQEALKSSADLEVKRRAQQCLDQIQSNSEPDLSAAVARLIAKNKPEGAAEVLLAVLSSGGSPELTDEFQAALTATTMREAKPEKILVDALTDKSPTKRATAAIALCRAGGADERKLARKLLGDADPTVQFQVARALIFAKEKDPIPGLIDLLLKLPESQARAAEDLLCRLPDDKPPEVKFADSKEGRQKCRDAWTDWWKEHGDKLDLAKKELDKLVVVLDTSLGTIKIELFTNKAPESVKNFLGYVDRGFYDNTIFHRVIPDFVIQGGGYSPGMKEKRAKPAIKNEARTSGLSNTRGTVAAARAADSNSATSQFFINLKENVMLNPSNSKEGYAVFGTVIQGMDVVDKIANVKTTNNGGHSEVPETDVIIRSARKSGK